MRSWHRFRYLLLLLAAALFLPLATCSRQPDSLKRGHLVIIGGGKRPDYMMQKIVELAGSDSARILIVPNASSDPVGSAENQLEQFRNLGVRAVDYVNLTDETADHDSNLAKLDGVTGVFFPGGSQRRLARALAGTEFLEKIRAVYRQGGLVSGTSAGAAVMSGLMITGDDLVNRDSLHVFGVIQEGNIEVREGFGLITTAIIDQHFIRRKRLNRLITLVIENPQLLGVGIDESTAIIVKRDDTFEVLGEYTVMVFDASQAKHIGIDGNGNLSASDISMHVLRSGQRYDLKSRRVLE